MCVCVCGDNDDQMVMTRVAEMYEGKLKETMLSLRIKTARGKHR